MPTTCTTTSKEMLHSFFIPLQTIGLGPDFQLRRKIKALSTFDKKHARSKTIEINFLLLLFLYMNINVYCRLLKDTV